MSTSEKSIILRSRLNDLKVAHETPKLFLVNYFDNLRNQIDIECEIRIQDSTNSEANEIIKTQMLLIDEVNLFQGQCIDRISNQSSEKNQEQRLKLIEEIESKLNTIDVLIREKVDHLYEEIEMGIENVLSVLLSNQSFLILTKDHFSEETRCSDIEPCNLLVINDSFISQDMIDLQKHRFKNWTTESFKMNDLKVLLMNQILLNKTEEITKKSIHNKDIHKSFDLNLSKINLLDLQYKIFRQGMMDKLGAHLFKNFSHLNELNISGNCLIYIDSRTFEGLNNLKMLNLAYNKLTNLESNTFKGLYNLRELCLSTNKISNINPGIFQDLGNLEKLDLVNNQLTKLEDFTYTGLRNLKELHLAYNGINEISSNSFTGLRKLEVLGLAKNKIDSINPIVFHDITSLKSLYLYHNSLTCLDMNLTHSLRDLECLYLHYNRLKFIEPDLIKCLGSLRELNLCKNQIECIDPDAFQGLIHLRELYLSDNQLSKCNKRDLKRSRVLKSINLRL